MNYFYISMPGLEVGTTTKHITCRTLYHSDWMYPVTSPGHHPALGRSPELLIYKAK